MLCNLCPRGCNVERNNGLGVCKTSQITISRVAKHAWEEPCISGEKGSGTIFFAGCNLHCRFCQNYDISVVPHGAKISVERLADILLYAQDMGVHNINLVTPTHFSDEIARALQLCKSKLRVPVVYNTGSYEKVEALARLEGLVDVYLPDLKWCLPEVAFAMCGASNYFEKATQAISEMRRQQPRDVFDENGIMANGVIIRHLVLPSFVEDSKRVLDWIASFDKNAYVSLMSQYFVARHDDKIPALNRRLYKREYDNIRQYFENVGLSNGYCQDLSSATVDYLPDFDDTAIFEVVENAPHVFTGRK